MNDIKYTDTEISDLFSTLVFWYQDIIALEMPYGLCKGEGSISPTHFNFFFDVNKFREDLKSGSLITSDLSPLCAFSESEKRVLTILKRALFCDIEEIPLYLTKAPIITSWRLRIGK